MSQGQVELEAQPTSVTGSLDPTMRDKVRLEFTVRTSTGVDTVYAQEQAKRLQTAPKVVVAVTTGLAAIVGVVIAIGVTSAPTDYWHPTLGSREAEVARWVGTFALMVVASAIVGGLTYWGLDQLSAPLPTREVTIRAHGPPTQITARGTVVGPGLPDGRRELIQGALELTFEEAQRLQLDGLLLNGKPVEWTGATVERLSFLATCARAILGFDPLTLDTQALSALAARWQLANVCNEAGWGFADGIIAALDPKFIGSRLDRPMLLKLDPP